MNFCVVPTYSIPTVVHVFYSTMSLSLPEIKLPTFNGSVGNWASFRDMFNVLIHDNSDLHSIQKFLYLKSCLAEEAALLVQHLPLTSSNYEVAWNMLIETYSKAYSIVTYHLNNIINIQYDSNNHLISLKYLLTTLRTNLNALQSLNVDVKTWDIMLIHLIEAKLDMSLFKEWVRKMNKKTLPTLLEFYDFLEEMIIIAERYHSHPKSDQNIPSNTTSNSEMFSKSDKNIPSNTSSNSEMSGSRLSRMSIKKCPLCRCVKHKLYECHRFKSFAVKDKRTFVSQKSMCSNCLSTKQHTSDSCPSSGVCKICFSRHHTLLHISDVLVRNTDGQPHTSVNMSNCADANRQYPSTSSDTDSKVSNKLDGQAIQVQPGICAKSNAICLNQHLNSQYSTYSKNWKRRRQLSSVNVSSRCDGVSSMSNLTTTKYKHCLSWRNLYIPVHVLVSSHM